MKVLFPQPDGPMIAVTMFGWISKETSLRADAPPYETLRPRRSNTGSSVDGAEVSRGGRDVDHGLTLGHRRHRASFRRLRTRSAREMRLSRRTTEISTSAAAQARA